MVFLIDQIQLVGHEDRILEIPPEILGANFITRVF